MASVPKFGEGQEDFFDLNQNLSTLQKKIETLEDPSLKEIHRLTEEVSSFLRTTRKVAKVASEAFDIGTIYADAESLLNSLEDMKKKRWEEDRVLLEELHAIDAKIDRFAQEQFYFTPDENVEKLDGLYQEVRLFAGENARVSFCIDHAIESSFAKLADVHFLLQNPVYSELKEDSYEPNFIHAMKDLQTAFITNEARGRLLFMALTERQREEIQKSFLKVYGTDKSFQNASGFEKAAAIDIYVEDLKHLTHIAKTLIYFDEQKAFYLMDQLDKRTQDELDTLLHSVAWQEDGMKKVLANALMTCIENRILA